MATSMALLRSTLRCKFLPNSLHFLSRNAEIPSNPAVIGTISCTMKLPHRRQYSNKVLEGMGEYVEEEEPLDVSLLERSPFAPRPDNPAWKNTRRWHAKQYARLGKESGVDPAIVWPTRAELKKLIEEEKEYFPSLQEMQAELAAEKQAVDLERLKREKLIAANMAKMPQMIADYRAKKEEERAKGREQKAKRANMLALAKEKLGYAVDPRSPRFKQMVEEIEAEEKKKRKELKKKGIKV